MRKSGGVDSGERGASRNKVDSGTELQPSPMPFFIEKHEDKAAINRDFHAVFQGENHAGEIPARKLPPIDFQGIQQEAIGVPVK